MWEELLFKKGDVPGAPQTIEVHEDLLDDARNVRDQCSGWLGSELLTMSEMQNTCKNKEKAMIWSIMYIHEMIIIITL